MRLVRSELRTPVRGGPAQGRLEGAKHCSLIGPWSTCRETVIVAELHVSCDTESPEQTELRVMGSILVREANVVP